MYRSPKKWGLFQRHFCTLQNIGVGGGRGVVCVKLWNFHFKSHCGNIFSDNIYRFLISCGNHSFLMDSIQYRTELLVYDALGLLISVFFVQRTFMNVNNCLSLLNVFFFLSLSFFLSCLPWRYLRFDGLLMALHFYVNL